jgi:hypothetical protein
MTNEADLVQRQDALQAEAREVLDDLNLLTLLRQAGRPILIGSFVLGLMAWRDIDFNVLVDDDALSADLAFETMRPLASHPRISKLRYANARGPFNATGLPQDEGYYWGVRYITPAGHEWKLDVWFLLASAPRPELGHLEAIPGQLTPDTKLAILRIKDAWYQRPAYRGRVLSVDIYDAVLRHGVRTPLEFEKYLSARGKPID